MLKGLIIFILQIIFLSLRVKNIRQIQYQKPIDAAITSMMLATVGLAGTYLGIVDGLMDGNYYVIIGYIIGAGIGTYIAITKM